MGAIAGLWQIEGTPPGPDVAARLVKALSYRQPQPFGVYRDPAAPLVLVGRLREAAATDLDWYADGQLWIAFDGLLDNKAELRRDLTARGAKLRRGTDAEIVLAAYREWGEACQLRFEGLWAFAIWDRQSQALFLSLDRFGARSLYYLDEPRRFAFASALKAFLTLPDPVTQFDATMLASGIAAPEYIAARERSLLSGVFNLRPGYCLHRKAGERAVVRRWWCTLDHLHDVPQRYEEQAQAVRELFLDISRHQLQQARNIAVSLSSGLDSSSIAVSLAKARDELAGSQREPTSGPGVETPTLSSFTLGFERFGKNEIPLASATAQQIGIPSFTRPYTPADFAAGLEESIYVCEQVHKLRTTAWVLAQMMRERDVELVFVGVPGDLFGFARPSLATQAAFYQTMKQGFAPGKLIRLAQLFYREAGRLGAVDKSVATSKLFARSLWRLFGGRGSAPLAYLAQDTPGEPERAVAVPPWLRGAPEAPRIAEYEDDARRMVADLGYRNTYLHYHFDADSSTTVLREMNSVYEAWGIECQAPYHNWRLASLVFSLRSSEPLLHGERTKGLLRDAMRGLLPDAIYSRKGRVGFFEPISMFFTPELRPLVMDTLHSTLFQQSAFWDGPAVAAAVQQIYAGEQVPYIASVWRCVIAGILLRLFQERGRSAA